MSVDGSVVKMQVYNNKNYATSSEVANALGISDKTLRKRIQSGQLPKATESDSVSKRSYYSEQYVADAIGIAQNWRDETHRAGFLEQAIARIKASTTLDQPFKDAVVAAVSIK